MKGHCNLCGLNNVEISSGRAVCIFTGPCNAQRAKNEAREASREAFRNAVSVEKARRLTDLIMAIVDTAAMGDLSRGDEDLRGHLEGAGNSLTTLSRIVRRSREKP